MKIPEPVCEPFGLPTDAHWRAVVFQRVFGIFGIASAFLHLVSSGISVQNECDLEHSHPKLTLKPAERELVRLSCCTRDNM